MGKTKHTKKPKPKNIPASGNSGPAIGGKPDKQAGDKAKRDAKGRFIQGTVPPGGRPAGSPNKRTLILRELAEGGAEQILRKAVALAKSGNVTMIQFVLNKLHSGQWPKPVDLKGRSGLQAIDRIVALVADGKISTETAKDLATIIEKRVNIYVADELEKRIAALESGLPVIGVGVR